VAAGLFLYVALSNMVPEMVEIITTTKTHRQALRNFLWQVLGLMIGTAIMILLARYEEEIKV
jgi:zinc transporter ZupT